MCPEEELPERQRLYDAGKADAEIARAIGLKRNPVTACRRYRKLPSNHPAYGPATKACIMLSGKHGGSNG